MPRKGTRKGIKAGAALRPPTAPVPPDKALVALKNRVKTLESEIRSAVHRAAENHSRESEEFQKIYGRIAVISDHLAELDSQEEGREERVAAAIAATTHAAKVLERVELGLRPMLLKAFAAEKNQVEAEFTAQNYGSGTEPMDAHIRSYYIHQSSIRS